MIRTVFLALSLTLAGCQTAALAPPAVMASPAPGSAAPPAPGASSPPASPATQRLHSTYALSVGGNLDARIKTVKEDPGAQAATSVDLSAELLDSLGEAHAVTLRFTHLDRDRWSWAPHEGDPASVDPLNPSNPGPPRVKPTASTHDSNLLTFGPDGRFDTPVITGSGVRFAGEAMFAWKLPGGQVSQTSVSLVVGSLDPQSELTQLPQPTTLRVLSRDDEGPEGH